MAIDSAVCSAISERLIGLRAPTATWQEVFPLAESLPVGSPSQAERDAFLFLFYTAGTQPDAPREIRRRKGTIDLLRAILPEGGEFVDVPEIRRRLSAGTIPDDAKGYGSEVRTSAVLFTILQARQLQRLATEAMMLWIERSLSTEVANAKPTDELVRAAQAAAERGDEIAASAASVGAYFDAVEVLGGDSGWPRAAALPDTDAIGLMEQLSEAQRKDPARLPRSLCGPSELFMQLQRRCATKNFRKASSIRLRHAQTGYRWVS
jgi:hypothetical protein